MHLANFRVYPLFSQPPGLSFPPCRGFTVPTLAPWPRRVAVAGETRRVERVVVVEDRAIDRLADP